eukprot:3788992-Pleurochrysis_carterae.AAC.1
MKGENLGESWKGEIALARSHTTLTQTFVRESARSNGVCVRGCVDKHNGRAYEQQDDRSRRRCRSM